MKKEQTTGYAAAQLKCFNPCSNGMKKEQGDAKWEISDKWF